jgi:hypothetical protein
MITQSVIFNSRIFQVDFDRILKWICCQSSSVYSAFYEAYLCLFNSTGSHSVDLDTCFLMHLVNQPLFDSKKKASIETQQFLLGYT